MKTFKRLMCSIGFSATISVIIIAITVSLVLLIKWLGDYHPNYLIAGVIALLFSALCLAGWTLFDD